MSYIFKNVRAKMNKKRASILIAGILLLSMMLTLMGMTVGTKAVHVYDDNKEIVLYTMSEDVDNLVRTNVALGEDDEYVFSGFDQNNVASVQIYRAFDVEIQADGETQTVPMALGTVEDTLVKAGVQISDTDLINTPLTETVTKNTKIKINRVTQKTYESDEELEYDIETVEDDTLIIGTEKVVSEGEKGLLRNTFTETYVDGELTNTELTKQEVVKEAVREVVHKGTKEEEEETAEINTSTQSSASGVVLDENGAPLNYSRVLTGSATAYTATGNRTATGDVPFRGGIAVNPNIIPYGSRVYIVTSDGSYIYGVAVANDTGGALMSGAALVDLYMDSTAECLAFGRRTVNVYILD